MTSTRNTQQNSQTGCYMIVPEANRYRWLGWREDASGLALARVRYESVASTWKPLLVEWLPETAERSTCDFPIFHPVVRCMSKDAWIELSSLLKGGVEILPLNGVRDQYVGFHCVRWLDAADRVGLERDRDEIHSTLFTPLLRSDAISGYDIFGVRDLVTKIFVSERVRSVVEERKLTGIEFHPVRLA